MDVTEGRDWLEHLETRGGRSRRLAVVGAGVLGNGAVVPWLIDRMNAAELARPAGEAFSMITGVKIAYAGLSGGWPAGFTAGPTEDPKDENVEMDPDENLPWPDPNKIADWWQKHGGEFEAGTRYLAGKPMTTEWLQRVLRRGFQRQRAAAALELAILQPSEPLFEVRAPGFRQQELLR
jgi:uncharacterized protein (TIGR02270 family)